MRDIKIQKKNGLNFSLTITLRDIIWTFLFIVSLIISYDKLVLKLDAHIYDNLRHLTKEERELIIRMDERLKDIDEKLSKIIDQK